MDGSETDSDRADLEDFDIKVVSEEMTDEYLRFFSQVFGQDLTAEVNEEQRQNAINEVGELLSEWVEISKSDADDEEVGRLMLNQFNDVSDEILETEPSDENPFWAFVETYEEINEKLEDVRELHGLLGYPEYYDCIKNISEDLVEEGKSFEFTEAAEEVFLDKGELLLQNVISRYNGKVELILDNPEIEDTDTARLYLREYERECETFKKTIPLVISAVELLEGKEPDLESTMNKRLGTYIDMVSAKSRSRINLLSEPVNNKYRNSIAHDDHLIDPVENQVKLMDQGEVHECLSFAEVRDLLVEMFCLSQSLFMFYMVVKHEQNYTDMRKLEEKW